jgi:colanic acid/amylovoran biosynthesis glycosyltransferase
VSEATAQTPSGVGDRIAGVEPPLRLAYVASRFPKVTETFVVRELNEIDARSDIDAELFGIFPPARGESDVHPSARRWLSRIHRAGPLDGAGAFLRWSRRRPLTVLVTLLRLVWGFRRRPRLLAASLGAMLIACAHAETMLRLRIQHVHAHFVGHTATAAWVIRQLADIPYSVTAHAYDLFQDQEFLAERIQGAQFVITISRYNAGFIHDFCHGVTPPIAVVRAGVDLQQFRYVERALPASGPVRALCVASLMPHKGHRVLLDALAGDDPALARIRVTVVGDGSERSALESQARRLGLSARVRFMGSLPEDRVAELMGDADLFVLPSLIGATGRMEGVPVVLMEALACGVPAVATRLSGIPELIEEGVTGTLAEQGDVASMQRALKRVLDAPDRALEMVRAGRERVVTEYDVANSAAVLANYFRAAARRRTQLGSARRPAFIAWSRSDRSPELAAAVGADCHTVFISWLARRSLVPVRYILSALSTTGFLLRHRPTIVVATNPPIFPALIAFAVSRVTGSELILDSHPRGFGRKGSRLGKVLTPAHRYLVRRARATLVPGPELASIVERWGGRSLIIHEARPRWRIETPPRIDGRPTVLWISIFAQDEPVADVVEAARMMPSVDFLITGDVRQCPVDVRADAPSNVVFTGFWAADGYRRLIERSDVMLVLTTERTSVPRAAFEAVEGLRPLVVSDWPALRGVFEDAVFAGNSAENIAHAVQEALDRHAELVAAAPAARRRQRQRWDQQRRELMASLGQAADHPPG